LLGVVRKKPARPRQKEYFTIMILPGPNSRVHKFSISKTLLKNIGIALLAVTVISAAMLANYFHMQGQVWELASLRAESMQHKQELKQFASSIVDMKGQMSRLKELDERLRSLAHMGGGEKDQRLGIGGSKEMSTINLDELGNKTHKEMMEQMSQELDNLKGDAAKQELSMKRLTDFFEHRNSVLGATPDIWPVRGFITSEFGRRNSPIYGTTQFHEGLDIGNGIGTPVVAPANGTVTEAGYQSGYGRYIKIAHGYGMETLFGHLSESMVITGQRVKKGETIGKVGNTGSSTGPHLHYEVRVNGVPVNPRKYL